MKKILIVTYIDFWRDKAGHISRLNSVLNFLKNKAELTILYIGEWHSIDDEILSRNFKDINVNFLHKGKQLDVRGYMEKFSVYIADKFFDIALLEYIEMYFILDFFPAETITVLDSHDLLSDKIKSFKEYGLLYDGIMVDFEHELKIFDEFDYVILINKKDYNKVIEKFPAEKMLLIPHPISYPKIEIREKVKTISFVASGYSPNVEGIEWFLDNVWPSIHKKGLELKIYGHVTKKMKQRGFGDLNICLIGYVDNLEEVYQDSDIIINPVRAGAGLKIKNIEALGSGLPLVTTSHGVSGIEDATGKALLMADSAQEFTIALDRLINDFSFRKEICDAAYAYAENNFSEQVCFQPFLKLLKN